MSRTSATFCYWKCPCGRHLETRADLRNVSRFVNFTGKVLDTVATGYLQLNNVFSNLTYKFTTPLTTQRIHMRGAEHHWQRSKSKTLTHEREAYSNGPQAQGS